MNIFSFPSGPIGTNGYLILPEGTKEAILIDAPSDSAKEIEQFLIDHEKRPVALLLTHSHWDHIADCSYWVEHYGLPVYVHTLDLPNLESPGDDGLMSPVEISPCKASTLLEEGMKLNIADKEIEVLHTPGHSIGSVCFYFPRDGVIFTGDTLFKGTYGNISFPTSAPKLMKQSLARLASLPNKTRIYPGHGPETTIEEQPWSFWI